MPALLLLAIHANSEGEFQRGTGMKNPTAIPTAQELFAQRVKERGLSRSQLVQAIDHKNINKGIRRLDGFFRTLKALSGQYFQNLISVLDVDGSLVLRFFNRSQKIWRKPRRNSDPTLRFSFLSPPGLGMHISLFTIAALSFFFGRYKICPISKN